MWVIRKHNCNALAKHPIMSRKMTGRLNHRKGPSSSNLTLTKRYLNMKSTLLQSTTPRQMHNVETLLIRNCPADGRAADDNSAGAAAVHIFDLAPAAAAAAPQSSSAVTSASIHRPSTPTQH